ncbi:MAG: tetratricopeptide repeat protein [Cyanobacteria bacterium SZAS LIN-5]|nr:tetratricopeptide repeat protein [Cyanobacteria bacterium SZAS LIN-5]RTL35677.1 MAG: tetratricopeptide repeat protein [Candidatus Melainabacteria bacterium]
MNELRRIAIAAAFGIAVGCSTASLPVAAQVPAAGGQSPHAISLYNLGLTAYKQGSPESAIIFFKRACDIDPNLADAQYNLGVLYQSQKRCKEAVPRFQEVLRVKPMDPDAHYQLGVCLTDLGQTAEARQHLTAIAPNNAHFAEAQRRIQMIDSGQTSQIVAAPPVQTTQVDSNVTGRMVQGGGTVTTAGGAGEQAAQPMSYPPPAATQQQQPVQQQPVQQIAVQAPQAAAPQVQEQPATMPKFNTPPSPTGPVAVLPNAAVRVIATGFSAPAGLSFGPGGSLYIANFLNNTIDRITADGSRSQFASGANIKGPIGLIVDNPGNVYVANYVSGTVVRISPAGISSVIATGFRKPYYLALDKEGNLFVSQQEDNSVVRITLPRTNVGVKP